MHNEVVLDSSVWVNALPHTIQAFFAVKWPAEMIGPPHDCLPVASQRVHELHRDYLRDYGLTRDQVPLLVYDAARTPPFRELRAEDMVLPTAP